VPLDTCLFITLVIFIPPSLVLDSLSSFEAQHTAHRCELEWTYAECHLKRDSEKELSIEGSSQVAKEHVSTTAQTTIQSTHILQTLHPQPSTNLHATTADPIEHLTAQTDVLAMNTSAPNTVSSPSHQHQTIKTQEYLQQDFEEEIEAVIEDKLALLHKDNEHLRLMQEHLARWKAMEKRSQVMQKQIEQERAIQVELQQAIEDLLQQEQEPSMQEPPLQ
jgi:hypothetical protein